MKMFEENERDVCRLVMTIFLRYLQRLKSKPYYNNAHTTQNARGKKLAHTPAREHTFIRMSEMIMEPEWAPAGVCILGRSRSQYFRFETEPESTLRSVQEPIKNFKGPVKISLMMPVVKWNGIN